MAECNGRSFKIAEPDLAIFSDSSLSGWGAVCDEIVTRGPWTTVEQQKHINELELLAAFNGLKSFTSNSYGISVCLFLDNSTAVAYVNKCGGTRSRNLSRVAERICD